MAEFLKKIPTNLTEYPNSFKRQGAFPLEAYSVFYTKAEADTYAASDPLAYVGQTIAVALDDAVTLYIIDQNSQLKEVGSLPVGDDQSIAVVDGKIQLVGFEDATHGAVAQIKVTTDEDSGTTTKELVWTPISELVGGEMEDVANRVTELEEQVEDHEERIVNLEKIVEDGYEDGEGNIIKPLVTQVNELNGLGATGAVRSVEHTNGEYILKDTQGTEVGRIQIAEAVTNFAYHASYPGKDGKTYDNVLVLELSDGEEQIIEIEDLVKIYDVEKNATEVQITITPSNGPVDENDPSSDQPNIISAKLTDAVKLDIAKGVKAHDALDHTDSEVGFGADDDPTLVIIKDSAVTEGKIKDKAVTTIKIADGAVTTDKIDNGAVTEQELEESIVTKLTVISLDDNKANPHINGSNISGPVAEATHATTADSATNATNAETATQVKKPLTIGVGTFEDRKSYDGSNTLDVAFDPDVFQDSITNSEQVVIGLNPTTVFILDGGNAAGHTAA